MALRSLRSIRAGISLAKRAFGFGSPRNLLQGGRRALEVRPETGTQLSADPFEALKQAIDRRISVRFQYSNKDGSKSGMRIGNPHAMWTGQNGESYLHMYVDPQSASASGGLPGWRKFILRRIGKVERKQGQLLAQDFQFVVAPGWNPGWYGRQGKVIARIS